MYSLPCAVDAPRLLLDRKRAYYNDELYAQLNLLYTLPEQADSGSSISFPLKVSNWRHDKLTYWLEYISLTYGPSQRDVAGSGEATAINTLITQAEQSIKEVEQNNPASANNKPSANAVPSNVDLTKLDENKDKEKGKGGNGGKGNNKPAPKKDEEKKEETTESEIKDKGKPTFGKKDKKDEKDLEDESNK